MKSCHWSAPFGSLLVLLFSGTLDVVQADAGKPGDAVIRSNAGKSEIVITTTSRLAGAIDSLTWDGMEFIDSHDHGRQLQTAWNADAGVHPLEGETYNPTEAGSRDDGTGNVSSSKLVEFDAHGNTLDLLTHPAFWLKPGETSGGKPARNTTVLSDHLLRKHLVIGYKNLPNVVDESLTITLPAKEHNHACVVELLTGYMPPRFSRFLSFNQKTGETTPLTDGDNRQREQASPIIFCTEDGSHAMGVFSPPPVRRKPQQHEAGPTYGRWRFVQEKVVKWNCVYRLQDDAGLGGDYQYRVFVPVGTLDDVKSALLALVTEFKPVEKDQPEK